MQVNRSTICHQIEWITISPPNCGEDAFIQWMEDVCEWFRSKGFQATYSRLNYGRIQVQSTSRRFTYDFWDEKYCDVGIVPGHFLFRETGTQEWTWVQI